MISKQSLSADELWKHAKQIWTLIETQTENLEKL